MGCTRLQHNKPKSLTPPKRPRRSQFVVGDTTFRVGALMEVLDRCGAQHESSFLAESFQRIYICWGAPRRLDLFLKKGGLPEPPDPPGNRSYVRGRVWDYRFNPCRSTSFVHTL